MKKKNEQKCMNCRTKCSIRVTPVFLQCNHVFCLFCYRNSAIPTDECRICQPTPSTKTQFSFEAAEKEKWESSGGSSADENERWKLKPEELEAIAKKEAEMAGNKKVELKLKNVEILGGSWTSRKDQVENENLAVEKPEAEEAAENPEQAENMKIETENKEDSSERSICEQVQIQKEDLEVSEILENVIVEVEAISNSLENQTENLEVSAEDMKIELQKEDESEEISNSEQDQVEIEVSDILENMIVEVSTQNIKNELENTETSEEDLTSNSTQKDSNSPQESLTSVESSSSSEYISSICGVIEDPEDLLILEENNNSSNEIEVHQNAKVWNPTSKNRSLFLKRFKILEKHVESLEEQKAENEEMADRLVDEFCDFACDFGEKMSKIEKVKEEEEKDPNKFNSWGFTGDFEVKSQEFYNWKNAFCRELIENELEMRTTEIFNFLSDLYKKFEPNYGEYLSLSKIAGIINGVTIHELCRKSAIQKFEQHFRVKIPDRL